MTESTSVSPDVCQATHESVDLRIDRNDEDIRNLYRAVQEIKDAVNSRLPTWATLFLSFLTLLIGVLLSAQFRS
jgi:hypothetical protein